MHPHEDSGTSSLTTIIAQDVPSHYASGHPYQASKKQVNGIGYCCNSQVMEAEKKDSKTVAKCSALGCKTIWVCINDSKVPHYS